MKYLGCGSRETPPDVLNSMVDIGEYLAKIGWMCRSGGADGADAAFEAGCDKALGNKEIFLPWQGFNDSNSPLFHISDNAFVLASTIHPAWNKLSPGAKKLHARNCYQILGLELDDPVDLVVAWTKNGKEVGGTATALKLAKQYGIKVINLAIDDFDFKFFKEQHEDKLY